MAFCSPYPGSGKIHWKEDLANITVQSSFSYIIKAPPVDLCHCFCLVQVPCYRGSIHIHLRNRSSHLDLSVGRNSLFSTPNMCIDVAPKEDVLTAAFSLRLQSSLPHYVRISNMKSILSLPFARLSKLILIST